MLTFLITLLVALLLVKAVVNYRFDVIDTRLAQEEQQRIMQMKFQRRKESLVQTLRYATRMYKQHTEKETTFIIQITRGRNGEIYKRIRRVKPRDYKIEFALWKQNVVEIARVRQKLGLV